MLQGANGFNHILHDWNEIIRKETLMKITMEPLIKKFLQNVKQITIAEQFAQNKNKTKDLNVQKTQMNLPPQRR